MATLIHLKSNHAFYTDVALADVRQLIELGTVIPVWWYATYGRRFQEDLFIPDWESVAWLQTESDD